MERLTGAASVDAQITRYMQSTPEEQVMQLTSPDYVIAFPQIVKRVASPEGTEKYPQEVRETLFNGAVRALTELPLGREASVDPDRTDGSGSRRWISVDKPHIAASKLTYDIERDVTVHKREVGDRRDRVDNLFRLDLAGIILLGMTMPDDAAAMKKIIDAYKSKENNQGFKTALESLILVKSASRRWVKTNGLDAAIGKDFDEVVTEVILNLPENEIDVKRNAPKKLPRLLTSPDAPTSHSDETMGVFLDYAVQFAQDLPMTEARSRDLVDFTLNVRRKLGEFLANPETQAALKFILEATNKPYGRKVEGEPNYDYPLDVKQIFPNASSRQLRRYYRRFKQIIS